jgi:hypothetical protein
MATEQEELKLIVTLVDNASPGLDKIVQKTKEMGGPEVKQAHEKMREGTKELNKAISEITGGFGEAFKALGAFRGGLVAGVGGLALFGIEMTKQIGELKKWAEELRGINQAAKQIGVDPAQMKSLIEQFQAAGVSADQTKANIAKLAEGLADLDRIDSKIRREMLHMMGPSPESQRAMRQFLDDMREMAHQGDLIGAAERLRVARQQVLNNALREGKSLAEATNRANEFASHFWDATLDATGKLNQLSKEEAEVQKQRLKQAEQYATTMGKANSEWSSIIEELRAPFLQPAIDASEKWLGILKSIHEFLAGANAETKRRQELDKVLPETNPVRAGWSAWRQRLQQRQYFLEHPNVEIPHSTKEAEEVANKKALEENTDATKRQKESTDQLIDQLKSGYQYSPMSYTGPDAGRNPLLQNASFTTGGGGSFGAGGNYGHGPFGGGRGFGGASYGSSVGPGTGAGAGHTPATGGGGGGAPNEPGGPRSMESRGGSGGITAPAGTPIQHGGMTTVTTPSGKSFRVDSRYAENFKGFLSEYEAKGGVIGSASGTLGERPHNASGHPIGTAIDINQVARDVRGGTGKSLPTGVEDELAKKWGFVSGHRWRNPDTGHFGIESPKAAKDALIANGVPPDEAERIVRGGGAPGPGPGTGKGAGNTPAGGKISGGGAVNEAIRSTAGTAGMDEAHWKAIASIESSLNPSSNINARKQYKGLFQINREELGGRGNMYDAQTNAEAAAAIAASNNAWFKQKYGRDPTPTETYMMHQQGRGFYARGTMTNIAGNPYPGMRGPQMHESFEAGWGREIERRAQRYTDDRQEIDKAAGSATKVEGSGKISVDVNAPKGTGVSAEGKGIFKDVEINRQTQMEPAKKGPETLSI